MSNTSKATKPDYLSLITKRAEGNRRRLHRVPLCLEPELFADRDSAREAHTAAVQAAAAQKALGTTKPARLTDESPVDAAKKALDAVEDQIRDVTIVLVMAGRSRDETAAVVEAMRPAELPDDATDDEKASARTENVRALNAALILDAFVRAEDVDGTVLPDVTVDMIGSLIPTLSTGESEMLVMARNIASSAPDFPTWRRS